MKAPIFVFLAASAALVLASCGGARAPVASTTVAAKSASFPPGSLQDELQKAGFDVPKADIMAEDFNLVSLAGKSLSLSSWKGKVVLLSFWATWCGPCKIEMPGMEKLYGQMKAKGLEIVAVDVSEDRSTVSSFIRKYGYTFPVLLDLKGEVSGSEMYAAGGIPVNYIIDRNGKLLARVIGIGGPEWDSDVRKALFDRLLKL